MSVPTPKKRHRWGQEGPRRFHWSCLDCGLVKYDRPAGSNNHRVEYKMGKVLFCKKAPNCPPEVAQ